jgi:hypothetical protein
MISPGLIESVIAPSIAPSIALTISVGFITPDLSSGVIEPESAM